MASLGSKCRREVVKFRRQWIRDKSDEGKCPFFQPLQFLWISVGSLIKFPNFHTRSFGNKTTVVCSKMQEWLKVGFNATKFEEKVEDE